MNVGRLVSVLIKTRSNGWNLLQGKQRLVLWMFGKSGSRQKRNWALFLPSNLPGKASTLELWSTLAKLVSANKARCGNAAGNDWVLQGPASITRPETSCRRCGLSWKTTRTPVEWLFSEPCSERSRHRSRGFLSSLTNGPKLHTQTTLDSSASSLPPPGLSSSGSQSYHLSIYFN